MNAVACSPVVVHRPRGVNIWLHLARAHSAGILEQDHLSTTQLQHGQSSPALTLGAEANAQKIGVGASLARAAWQPAAHSELFFKPVRKERDATIGPDLGKQIT
jgi:hypothetical protein